MKTKVDYLVIGGLGFVGNEVVRQLMKDNSVAILDNRNRIAPDIDDLGSVKVYDVDIRNGSEVMKSFKACNPRYVIHLAAIHFIPECNADPSRTLDVNLIGTYNVIAACEAVGIEGFIMASSGAIYSDSREFLKEQSDIAPVDIYGLSKLFCEQLFSVKNYSFNVTVARLFNVYGPRETNAHIIPEIISQVKHTTNLELGNIDTFRDYVHVEDAARAFIHLVQSNKDSFVAVNIGTSKAHSTRDLVQKIGDILDVKIVVEIKSERFRPSDKLVQKADNHLLQTIVGGIDFRSLEEGLLGLLRYERLL